MVFSRCLFQHLNTIGNAKTFDGVKLFLPHLLQETVTHFGQTLSFGTFIFIFFYSRRPSCRPWTPATTPSTASSGSRGRLRTETWLEDQI